MKKLKMNKEKIIIIALIIAAIIAAILGIYSYKKKEQYTIATQNNYNMMFYELVDYIQNVETYLAKSLISTSPEHGAETLTNVWREASMAQSALAQLPLESNEFSNTSKFLNQVSDYSYSLSRKNIEGEALSKEDLDNIKELHIYSVELENTLNQLSTDLDSGRIKWNDLTKNNKITFATQVSSITSDSFSSLEENFHEYSGLIYDGAFSEHLTSTEKKGLVGDDIDEEAAKMEIEKFYGLENIEEISFLSYSDNAEIPSFDFVVNLKKEKNNATVAVSKKGGHIIFANYDKSVETETISQEQADEIGKKFLEEHGYADMKETYYLKQNGIVTINYAYKQIIEDGSEVTIYPDLIKLKISLGDGSVLGIETTGYLNSHEKRNINNIKITKAKAKEILNKELEIENENLAIIPTQWKTEILCWEFKGKVENNEFLVYINAETGEEEDILVIINTPDGTLTH